ncbi:hypothetical protein SODALDRAFT_334159 [Sodiomyces alkalinus F11]|uniref:DNA helicase n=1 Tax=Sodiomyces alkalinus (strain CBS 110278 / VKM F-3762 / F11) TaxID=1314773 RepID=A0A3N2PRE5_SODAK|nr:hypothetical protein SODALDRAFT_334159 [Sodiomyces alkalinus F11]ROT37089.1 hypothetical protein SODALDRAFT_334159 [Sodiomyces alkalinus F11]
MTETASPNIAHRDESSPTPNHVLQPAPTIIEGSKPSTDALQDSSSELSDLDATTNAHDFDFDFDLDSYPPTQPPGHEQPTASDQQEADEHEHPSKRRRLDQTPPPPSTRVKGKKISPPWKKVIADGPTSYTENGRRKSGRINLALPKQQDQQSPSPSYELTRTSRAVFQETQGTSTTPTKRIKNSPASTNGHVSSQQRPTPRSNNVSRSTGKATSAKAPQSSKSSTRGSSSRASWKRTPSPPTQPTRHSNRARKPTRTSLDGDTTATPPSSTRDDARHTTQELPARPTRIRLRVRGVGGNIPLLHPGQVGKRAKIGLTFEEYWEKAGDIPLEDGGYVAEDERYTEDMAKQDARIILRVEEAVEPGGILSRERCSAFVPEPADDPPRQWAHLDHMVRAATNFRKLMLAEQQRHRSQAKKLAEACRDAWLRKQPKSAEELEAEAREAWIARYRGVMRSMYGTWENVRAEINRRRLREWEVEEQRRVKAALNEAVTLSEQKLQAQRGQLESEEDDDDDDDGDEDEDEDEEEDAEMDLDDEDLDGDIDDSDDEKSTSDDGDASSDSTGDEEDNDDVMSSSDEDEEEEASEGGLTDAADETLTQEQLRAKYANLPELHKLEPKPDKPLPNGTAAASPGTSVNADEPDQTSDESIDMDDDMGSTEEDSDESGDEEDSVEEDSEEEGEPAGLLGLFFGQSELKKLQAEATSDSPDQRDDTSIQQAPDGDTAEGAQSATPQALPLASWDGEKRDDGPGGFEDDDEEPDLVQIPDPTSTGRPTPTPTTRTPGQAASTPKTSTAEPPPVTNGITPAPEGQESTAESAERILDQPVDADVDMIDPPNGIEPVVPELSVTSPKSTTKLISSDTDAITRPATSPRSHSHSPSTSDTKPSDPETTSLTARVKGGGTSRSASPSQSWTPKTEIPSLLRGTLREYQHYGLDWLAGLYANNTNGILADEMGLGKTIQTIALLAHLACHHGVWGPHLVIVPTSVMLNWEMEFKKWCPGFKILSYYGTQEERKRKRQGWTNDDVWNVCITSYQLVLQDQQVFKRRRWHYMILDEAHNIKNFKSQRWQTLLGFNTHSRLLLTGTPLQNNLTELWSLLFFLMPSENGVGGFADLQEFHDWFHKPEAQILESGRETMDDEARAIIAKLHKVLRPYLLRRLKADVEKQMPAKYEHVEFCRLSKRQRELYDGFLARADTRNTLASGNYMSIINCLMQLRKVCNHPDLFVDRPIMTSFRMQRSVAAEYDLTNRFVETTVLATDPMTKVSLGVINLIPTQHEGMSLTIAERISQLSLHRVLMDLREAQNARAHLARTNLDPSTVASNLAYLESLGRWRRFEELQHCVYINALRGQRRPIYGKRLTDFLTLGLQARPRKPRPKVPQRILQWFSEDSGFLRAVVQTRNDRAAMMETTMQKFGCVTPVVVTRDMTELVLGRRAMDAFGDADLRLSAPVRWAPFMRKERPVDPWHEARMRLSIQFPDKRLLQYDCGKLQALDRLLRKLQAGGHRALIFTQMTKVLDILEQFLNIHGHKYLRLDGATKVEQRQILTDRFNNDPRVLCFILSTRSGGLGINLTGADTVIFYDQDWNPAMDKQCQDRCHRIGQTRDVHIYRLISEHTIEANILRKASQKQMLDDVVIQEGAFTTDYYLNQMSSSSSLSLSSSSADRGAAGREDADLVHDGMAAANAAMDRLLGGVEKSESRNVGRVFAQAEDQEDVVAAKAAEREIQADDADFLERGGGGGGGSSSAVASGASSTRQGTPRDDNTAAASGAAAVEWGGGPGPSALGRFSESAGPGAAASPSSSLVDGEPTEVEVDAWGRRMGTIDDYMVEWMGELLKDTPLELPKDKKKSKKKRGRDTRKR